MRPQMRRVFKLPGMAVGISERLGSYFPKYPIPMKTTVKNCFLINYSVDLDVLQEVLPRGLEPDIRMGRGFVSVVIADMKDMRPFVFPRLIGRDYTQVVYRAIVRAPDGERGVYFFRSQSNDILMGVIGNLFSTFKYEYAGIEWDGLENLPPHWSTFSPLKGERMPEVEAPEQGWLRGTRPRSENGKYSSKRFHEQISKKNGKGGLVSIRVTPRMSSMGSVYSQFDMSTSQLRMPASSLFAGKYVTEAQPFFTELYASYAPLRRDTWCRVSLKRTKWNVLSVDHTPGGRNFDMFDNGVLVPKGACSYDSTLYATNLEYRWDTGKEFSAVPKKVRMQDIAVACTGDKWTASATKKADDFSDSSTASAHKNIHALVEEYVAQHRCHHENCFYGKRIKM